MEQMAPNEAELSDRDRQMMSGATVERQDQREERQQRLTEIRQQIDGTTDKLGHAIEPGIIELVVTLNAMDLETSQSCEGHLDWGMIGPWVEIYPQLPEANEWYEDDALREKVDREGLAMQDRVINLLSEFYQDRKPAYEAMLSINRLGYGFRIFGHGTERLRSLSIEQRQEKLPVYQSEMTDFSNFVREKYLTS